MGVCWPSESQSTDAHSYLHIHTIIHRICKKLINHKKLYLLDLFAILKKCEIKLLEEDVIG